MFENLKETAQAVDFCQRDIFSAIVEQRPYVLIFKTTNWCWNNCPHCCESSGPNNPKTFIPEDVITGYITQAAKDSCFSKHIVFTGGEIMSAYKFVDEYYVPNILDCALNNNLGTDIKTNAGWVGTPIAPMIFRDFENLIRRHKPKITTSKTSNRTFPMHVSLSLDRFHNDSIERNFKFIEHFATKKISGAKMVARISSFEFDAPMFTELLTRLRDAGMTVAQVALQNSKTGAIRQDNLFSVNDNFVFEYEFAQLFDGGRAKNLSYAEPSPLAKFTLINDDADVLVAFDSFGNVTLGENSGEKISVPWRNADGTPRSLTEIRADLVAKTKQAEQEFLQQHKLLGTTLVKKFIK